MRNIISLFFICMTLSVGAVTRTWTGSWDSQPSATSDDIVINSGGSLTWSNTYPNTVNSWNQISTYTNTATITTVFPSIGSFTNFIVTGDVNINGGTLSHQSNSTIESNRLQMTIGGNLNIANGASVSGYGLGFSALKGIVTNIDSSCGGSYGGVGADWSTFSITGKVYGAINSPTNLGSGGGVSGGGCVILNVGGTCFINTNATIIVDGVGNAGAGGGAGGSVFLTAGNLTGYGSITAKGGFTGNRGGGGGGRIAIVLTNSTTFNGFTGTILANGGTSGTIGGGYSDGGCGGGGTIYQKTTADNGTLIINNAGLFNRWQTYAETTLTTNTDINSFASIIITNSGVLALGPSNPFNLGNMSPISGGGELRIKLDNPTVIPVNCVITGNYVLCFDSLTNTITNLTITSGCTLTHRPNFNNEAYKLNFTVVSNLIIQTNALINVDGRGYFAAQGPGTAVGNTGGSYGGVGGNHDDFVTIGTTYGSILAPTNSGSGGSSVAAKNDGGGAIIINVGGICIITNGAIISASGSGFNGSTDGSSGAGGTIYIKAGVITGTGIIRANGQTTAGGNGGGGGGGRISLVQTANNSLFSGTVTTYGGYMSANGHNGSAGTIYQELPSNGAGNGTVTVDNNNLVIKFNAVTPAYSNIVTSLPSKLLPSENLTGTRWVCQNKGLIGVSTNTTISSLNISNTIMQLSGNTLRTKTFIANNVSYNGVYGPVFIPLPSSLVDTYYGGNVETFLQLIGF